MIHCPRLSSLFPILTCAFLAATVATGMVSRARADNLFEVRDVKVDVTADTAAAAREQALVQGETNAFQILMERLTGSGDRSRLPQLSHREIASYIQDYEVAEEKSSAVRYIATLNFTFRERDVRRLLKNYQVPVAITRSRPLLVLPVLQQDGNVSLWDEPNPWRDAWAAKSPSEGLVPMRLPEGDSTDVEDLSAEQAFEGDISALTAIARRYGASGALVALGDTVADTGDGIPEVRVSLSRYGAEGLEQTLVQNFTGSSGEDLDALLARVVDEMNREIQETWKQKNLVQSGERSVASVTVPIANVSEWVTVRDRLKRVSVVQHTELVLVSRGSVRANLHYVGTPEQLAVALQQVELALSPSGLGWVLQLASRGTTGTP